MTNEELIYNLRYCFEKRKTVVGVPWYVWCDRAADALEADEKRITELEAQLPKEGVWIIIGISVTGSSTAKCSKCDAIVHNSFTNTPNYCPNCGARMKEK